MLELQPAFAGSVGHRLHAAVILVPGTVEHDLRDPRILGPGSDALAHLDRLLCLLARRQVVARHSHQRATRHVVDDLRRDMLERTENHQARPLRRPRNLLADAEMAAIALLFASLRNTWHDYLPPALPALRRMTSPA